MNSAPEWIEVIGVDQNGSGITVPTLIRTDEIVLVFDLSGTDAGPKGANSAVKFRTDPNGGFLASTYEEVIALINPDIAEQQR